MRVIRFFFSFFLFSFGCFSSIDAIHWNIFRGTKHLFFGPETYHLQRVRRGAGQAGWLSGVRGGIDRWEENSLYWGFEGYTAEGYIDGKTSANDKVRSWISDKEVEGRIGFTFCKKFQHKMHFVPYVGAGYFWGMNKFIRPKDMPFRFHDTFSYATIGFISRLFITKKFLVGVNFKANYMYDAKNRVSDDPDFDDRTLVMGNQTNYEVDLPIGYQFCIRKQRLQVTIVPFYRFRHYGKRENFPFDFFDTKFYIYGGRLLFELIF